jgi:hypothetical protein
MRLVVSLLGLSILACASPRDWYDSPGAVEGSPYKNCKADVQVDDVLSSDRSYNNKGYLELSHNYAPDGSVESVTSYGYDKDGKTLLTIESGPSEGDVAQTVTYNYEKGDLTSIVSDDYSVRYTYGKDGRRETEKNVYTDAPEANETLTWTWSDGADGGDIADVESDVSDYATSSVWDKSKLLLSISADAGTYTVDQEFSYSDDAAKRLVSSEYMYDAGDSGSGTGTYRYIYDDSDRLTTLKQSLESMGYTSDSTTGYDWACD